MPTWVSALCIPQPAQSHRPAEQMAERRVRTHRNPTWRASRGCDAPGPPRGFRRKSLCNWANVPSAFWNLPLESMTFSRMLALPHCQARGRPGATRQRPADPPRQGRFVNCELQVLGCEVCFKVWDSAFTSTNKNLISSEGYCALEETTVHSTDTFYDGNPRWPRKEM